MFSITFNRSYGDDGDDNRTDAFSLSLDLAEVTSSPTLLLLAGDALRLRRWAADLARNGTALTHISIKDIPGCMAALIAVSATTGMRDGDLCRYVIEELTLVRDQVTSGDVIIKMEYEAED